MITAWRLFSIVITGNFVASRLPPQDRIPDPGDDGIPLEGHRDRPSRAPLPERTGTCWVCQCPVFVDKAVRVAKCVIPVCMACWDKIPPGERIKIGLQISADDDMRPLKQIAAAVLSRIKGESERSVDGDGDPFGIFRRGN